MQSDFADLRNDFQRGLDMIKATACAEGSHYSTDAAGNRQVSCSWNDRCYMAAARVLLDDQASVIQRLRAVIEDTRVRSESATDAELAETIEAKTRAGRPGVLYAQGMRDGVIEACKQFLAHFACVTG